MDRRRLRLLCPRCCDEGQDEHQFRADMCGEEMKLLAQKKLLLEQKIDALNDTLMAKNALITELTSQVGQIALPMELSNALADWVQQTGSDLVTFDETSGIVRFKSDLLFDKGSDVGLPFEGDAPDLGAFEYAGSSVTTAIRHISRNLSVSANQSVIFTIDGRMVGNKNFPLSRSALILIRQIPEGRVKPCVSTFLK